MHHRMLASYAPAAAGGAFTVDAADFDGTDLLDRGGNLTSIADSKTGILSMWVRRDQTASAETLFVTWASAAANIIQFSILASGSSSQTQLRLRMTDGNDVTFNSSSGLTSTATWYHLLLSWQLASSSVFQEYIDDVDASGTPSGAADLAVDYDAADSCRVCDDRFASTSFDGCVAELYFAPGQYLDFSVEANRRKFIDASGKPVDLGSDGSTPTGSQPILYLHLDDAEAVANFATNAGTGGNFTITGTLATCASSPSD